MFFSYFIFVTILTPIDFYFHGVSPLKKLIIALRVDTNQAIARFCSLSISVIDGLILAEGLIEALADELGLGERLTDDDGDTLGGGGGGGGTAGSLLLK